MRGVGTRGAGPARKTPIVNNFALDKRANMGYIIRMMNDELMDMVRVSCDECVCETTAAEIEHARGVREEEERHRAEVWAALEDEFGPLLCHRGRFDYSEYEGMAWKD